MRPALCGRADLVRALATGRSDIILSTARLLGFEYAPKRVIRLPHTELSIGSIADHGTLKEAAPRLSPLAVVPYWRVEACEYFAAQEDSVVVPDVGAVEWSGHTGIQPDTPPLARWSALLTRLRQVGTVTAATRHLDLNKAVKRLSEGEMLNRLPRQRRRSWGSRVQIIIDRSDRLIPYWGDQISMRAQLKRLFPNHAIETAVYWEGLDGPILSRPQHVRRGYSPPPSGSLVIVLGDLGCLSIDNGERAVWARLGRRLLGSGCRSLAVVPCQQACVDEGLTRLWQVLPWERAAGWKRPPSGIDQIERLLSLISPAVRIEPGFLREVRCLMGADACIEAYVWQHPGLISTSSVAATLDPTMAQELRSRFEQQTQDELRADVLALLRRWRAALPQEIWFEEIRSLQPGTQELLPEQNDLHQARQFFAHLSRDNLEGTAREGVRSWFSRMEKRISEHTWKDEEVGPALQRLWWSTHRDDADRPSPPPGYDARYIAVSDNKPLRNAVFFQQGPRLEMMEVSDAGKRQDAARGSWLGELATRNGQVVVAPLKPRFWRTGQPPSWASDWGEDEYGHWVGFHITKDGHSVTQRMRWIAPGQFLMGSPEQEPERWDDEGPQHRVTISQGFWLCDTTCTQALWQVVMGENPSHFQGSDRPVEQVSWNDCQAFLKKLNGLLPGLQLSLPTEAHWEYACRAGTQTPFSFGDIISTDQANYNSEYPYADGEKGIYRRETVAVASFAPNSWGLYQMHGNVYEWCEDGLREYSEKAEIDPVGPKEYGVRRVLRGGYWDGYARNVRSAARDAYDPGDRDGSIGFRCARVQGGAEPADTRQRRSVEQRRPSADRSGAAVLLQLRVSRHCQWLEAESFSISTDTGRLTLRSLTRPNWAAAIGRDHYGLWTELALEAPDGQKISQRLRWIPPGRFLMGSPTEESGRWENEGPRHQVTLSRGYWLFDTPLTQALWEAVMGKNPSEFKSPQRPVDNVSWHEAQDFIERINNRITGLNLVLPSEAQWEYACRAGIQTATYAGDLEILGERNAPLLDEIAWYGGNSGVNFDMQEGWDSSKWQEKQYPHERAGTREVGLKVANPWGLYDMLGNVWEWCLDGKRKYIKGEEIDPLGPVDSGVERVLRGGCWYDFARNVRSASRYASDPGFRNYGIGFRCARVQEEVGAEPVRGRGPAKDEPA